MKFQWHKAWVRSNFSTARIAKNEALKCFNWSTLSDLNRISLIRTEKSHVNRRMHQLYPTFIVECIYLHASIFHNLSGCKGGLLTVSWAGTEEIMLRASISQICTTAGLPPGESLPQIRFLPLQIFRASIDGRSTCSCLSIQEITKGFTFMNTR
jgi:hypothetical protein